MLRWRERGGELLFLSLSLALDGTLVHLCVDGKFNYCSYFLNVCSVRLLQVVNEENERRMLTIKSNQVDKSEEENE